jgi:hypothetical protein
MSFLEKLKAAVADQRPTGGPASDSAAQTSIPDLFGRSSAAAIHDRLYDEGMAKKGGRTTGGRLFFGSATFHNVSREVLSHVRRHDEDEEAAAAAPTAKTTARARSALGEFATVPLTYRLALSPLAANKSEIPHRMQSTASSSAAVASQRDVRAEMPTHPTLSWGGGRSEAKIRERMRVWSVEREKELEKRASIAQALALSRGQIVALEDARADEEARQRLLRRPKSAPSAALAEARRNDAFWRGATEGLIFHFKTELTSLGNLLTRSR